jgi:hypothetical protein
VLYRNNDKGQPADWRCEEHIERLPDQQVIDIAEMIGQRDIPRWDQKTKRFL